MGCARPLLVPDLPCTAAANLGLTDNFRVLTTRRSEWKGEGFVIGLGRVECWLESL